jgi:hypothetical protein
MKKLVALLLVIGVIACKKETQQPSTPQQQTTTPTPNPTDTTGNNTNDTVGKVKIYYEFISSPLTIGFGAGMTGRDYVQDTTNNRVLHNSIKLTNHRVVIDQSIPTKGLNVIENISTPTPVWCAIGDTIKFEIDSNEVNVTSGATSDRFEHTTIKVWKNTPYNTSYLVYNFDTHNYSAYPELSAIYNQLAISGVLLGTVKNQYGITQTYYLGGKLRLNFIVQ